jgi:hypothetical protein
MIFSQCYILGHEPIRNTSSWGWGAVGWRSDQAYEERSIGHLRDGGHRPLAEIFAMAWQRFRIFLAGRGTVCAILTYRLLS